MWKISAGNTMARGHQWEHRGVAGTTAIAAIGAVKMHPKPAMNKMRDERLRAVADKIRVP